MYKSERKKTQEDTVITQNKNNVPNGNIGFVNNRADINRLKQLQSIADSSPQILSLKQTENNINDCVSDTEPIQRVKLSTHMYKNGEVTEYLEFKNSLIGNAILVGLINEELDILDKMDMDKGCKNYVIKFNTINDLKDKLYEYSNKTKNGSKANINNTYFNPQNQSKIPYNVTSSNPFSNTNRNIGNDKNVDINIINSQNLALPGLPNNNLNTPRYNLPIPTKRQVNPNQTSYNPNKPNKIQISEFDHPKRLTNTNNIYFPITSNPIVNSRAQKNEPNTLKEPINFNKTYFISDNQMGNSRFNQTGNSQVQENKYNPSKTRKNYIVKSDIPKTLAPIVDPQTQISEFNLSKRPTNPNRTYFPAAGNKMGNFQTQNSQSNLSKVEGNKIKKRVVPGLKTDPSVVNKKKIDDFIKQSQGSENLIVDNQIKAQNIYKDNKEECKEKYTTVGFEFEFCKYENKQNLGKFNHLELGTSKQKMPLSGLGFILETDYCASLELITPPFLVPIISKETYQPKKDIVANYNNLFVKKLDSITSSEVFNKDSIDKKTYNIDSLKDSFSKDFNIDFVLNDYVKAEAKNLTNIINSEGFAVNENGDSIVTEVDNINDVELSKPLKSLNLKTGISTHINMALTADGYMNLLHESRISADRGIRGVYVDQIRALEKSIEAVLGKTTESNIIIAKFLSGLSALPMMRMRMDRQTDIFENKDNIRFKDVDLATIESSIKDIDDIWIKQDPVTVIKNLKKADYGSVITSLRGLLRNEEFKGKMIEVVKKLYKEVLSKENNQKEVKESNTSTMNNAPLFSSNLAKFDNNYLSDFINKDFNSSIRMLIEYLEQMKEGKDPMADISEKVDFMSHKDQLIGMRQDTYISEKNSNIVKPDDDKEKNLMVVELRNNLEKYFPNIINKKK